MTVVTCRAMAPWVTAMGSGEDVSFGPATRHISHCLRCQAQLARTRRMRRDLRSLADQGLEAPPTPFDVEAADRDVRDRGPLVILGAVAMVAVGAAGVRRLLAH